MKENRFDFTRWIALVVFLLVGSGASIVNGETTPAAKEKPGQSIKIKQVLRADLLLSATDRLIRLAGITAFEPYNLGWVDRINPQRRVLAKKAVERVRKLIGDAPVTVQFIDQFKNTINEQFGYVYLQDKRCLNAVLLQEGLAWIPPGTPDHAMSNSFKADQHKAATAKRGLWEIDLQKINVLATEKDEEAENAAKDETADVDEGNYDSTINPSTIDEDSQSSEAGGSGLGLLILIVVVIALAIFGIQLLRAEKTCPMCYAKMSKRAVSCSNCGYNFETGYLGDSELQTWVTQNIRVKKSGTKKKRRKNK